MFVRVEFLVLIGILIVVAVGVLIYAFRTAKFLTRYDRIRIDMDRWRLGSREEALEALVRAILKNDEVQESIIYCDDPDSQLLLCLKKICSYGDDSKDKMLKDVIPVGKYAAQLVNLRERWGKRSDRDGLIALHKLLLSVKRLDGRSIESIENKSIGVLVLTLQTMLTSEWNKLNSHYYAKQGHGMESSVQKNPILPVSTNGTK